MVSVFIPQPLVHMDHFLAVFVFCNQAGHMNRPLLSLGFMTQFSFADKAVRLSWLSATLVWTNSVQSLRLYSLTNILGKRSFGKRKNTAALDNQKCQMLYYYRNGCQINCLAVILTKMGNFMLEILKNDLSAKVFNFIMICNSESQLE